METEAEIGVGLGWDFVFSICDVYASRLPLWTSYEDVPRTEVPPRYRHGGVGEYRRPRKYAHHNHLPSQ